MGNAITSITPVAIGTEEVSEDISPTDVQSHVTADRFLSPIALISADENRLVKNGDRHLARCLIPVDFLCWSEPVPIFQQTAIRGGLPGVTRLAPRQVAPGKREMTPPSTPPLFHRLGGKLPTATATATATATTTAWVELVQDFEK
jgi:hypothetical protein